MGGEMVTAVWSWVRSIVLVLLLILGVEMLLPRSAFRQYLRLVAGMILVLVVMEPVLAWLGNPPTGIGVPGTPGGLVEGSRLPDGWYRDGGRGDGGYGDRAYGRSGEGGLTGQVRATVEAQVREAFQESVAAAVRAVVMESGEVADARAEVALAGGRLEIGLVRVEVRARSRQRMSSAERESLRELVASYLGIPRQLVTVGEG